MSDNLTVSMHAPTCTCLTGKDDEGGVPFLMCLLPYVVNFVAK